MRHPNYTGEIMVQWSWVLPLCEYHLSLLDWILRFLASTLIFSVTTVGLQSLAALYLPVVTTLMLIVRCEQTNIKNKRYTNNWQT